MQYFTISFLLILALANVLSVSLKGRIIGGEIDSKLTYPELVSVRSRDRHICGGTILDQDTILTAAHCIVDGTASEFSIRSGSDSADDGLFHRVYEILLHPEYDERTSSHDVGKLKINPPIIYSDTSLPIKLATERPDDNTPLIVSGWGRQIVNVSTTVVQRKHLRAAYVNVFNQDECARRYQRLREVNSVMICAAAKGRDSCQGDSGGPLINPKNAEQVGIISFGVGCANPNYPGVYSSFMSL
ncbi:trypsin 3A1-like [Episyrphus balteatus]|uniref:trypsin 3A1-like n=1 Tax=Episyrphus balteatus TaxID=286459 RepID=UPI0024867DC9|nr:trypsin 3A1-like [Episyrphus balteatus]